MKGYGQFCPFVRASEIVAERWTPVILRNMLLGCTTFGEILAGAPGLSKTLLSQRLRELERQGVLTRTPSPSGRGHTYHLTDVGLDLWDVVEALGTWGARWLDVGQEHLDPYPVLWDISKAIPDANLPARRVVIRFDISDAPSRNRFWLVLTDSDREVCLRHPGFAEDLVLRTDSRSLVSWHSGHVSLADAVRDDLISIDGPPRLVREFSRRWQGLSLFAGVTPRRPIAVG